MPVPPGERVVAVPPEGVEELCLLRMGLQARRLRALPRAWRLMRAIDRAAAEAIAAGAGLLHSERFTIAWNHLGLLQYWRSFDDLERWSRQAPHADWWRAGVEDLRRGRDLGIYHEAYAVPRGQLESIFLNCRPAGLAAFGTLGPATGPRTTARDRLGRRTLQGG